MSDRPPNYNFFAERAKLTPLPDARTAPLPSTHGVDAPCNAYEQMRPWWDVIKSVKGGTPDIRKGGKAFLPHEPFEREDAYGRRLGRSCFAPWYVRLVRGVVGMVLRKPIALQDVVPAIESHLDNINLLGDDLNSFAREVFEAAIDFGYTGIFVNYPKVEEGDVRTRAMRWKEAIALTGCITLLLRLLAGATARSAIGAYLLN
jgi:hypothetical protein